MKVHEILSDPIFDLPIRRDERRYRNFVTDHLNEYFSLLNLLEDFNIHGEHTRRVSARDIFKKSKKLAKALISIVREYQMGKPANAFEAFKEALRQDCTYITSILLTGDNLYRGRNSDKNRSLTRDQLFHIPFELRHLVATQRYSIPGFPCLYLADSAYTCWVELGKKPIELLNLSRYELTSPVELFTIPSPKEVIRKHVQGDYVVEGVVGIGIDSLLINWPLYFLSSIKVLHQVAAYKVEYVIPQLILQYVREESNLAGVKYFTTHQAEFEVGTEGTFNNYAFPVHTSNADGYCESLSTFFKVSTPCRLTRSINPTSVDHSSEHYTSVSSLQLEGTNAMEYKMTELYELESLTYGCDLKHIV